MPKTRSPTQMEFLRCHELLSRQNDAPKIVTMVPGTIAKYPQPKLHSSGHLWKTHGILAGSHSIYQNPLPKWLLLPAPKLQLQFDFDMVPRNQPKLFGLLCAEPICLRTPWGNLHDISTIICKRKDIRRRCKPSSNPLRFNLFHCRW